MITINGQKMGKSLGNFITLDELFTGSHDVLEKAYSPMAIRFFILQAHYRSTLDFSNKALQAAEKGYSRLMKAWNLLQKCKHGKESSLNIQQLEERCSAAINDDLNTPILIAQLFEGVKWINLIVDGKESLTEADLTKLKNLFEKYLFNVLGLKAEQTASSDDGLTPQLIDLLLSIRQEAKANKDFARSDQIRDQLTELGIKIKDSKEGSSWEI